MAVAWAILLGAGVVLPFAPAPAKKPAPKAKSSKSRKRRPVQPKVSAAVRQKAADAVAAWLDAEPTLENARALVPFFERLFRLEKAEDPGPVRILHYGDSHTAADEWTGTVRYLLQTKFGDGGAGFTLAGRPFRGYRRLDVRGSSSRGWQTLGTIGRQSDGMGGISGVSLQTTRARESITLNADCESAEVYFLRQPGGGDVEISDNGNPSVRISTEGALGPGLEPVFLSVPGEHELLLRTVDKAPVRLYGWVTEKSGGVTYESMGINGAQASVLLDWDESLLSAYLSRRNPALIVLAYGTNEASRKDWTTESYRGMFTQAIQRLRKAAPSTSILVIGPADRWYRVRGKWTVHPGIDRILAAQREAAMATGCAFWDLRARMGGEASMKQWVYAGMAQNDHVHFTGAGYRLLGGALYKELLEVYRTFVKVREEPLAAGDNIGSNGQTRTHP